MTCDISWEDLTDTERAYLECYYDGVVDGVSVIGFENCPNRRPDAGRAVFHLRELGLFRESPWRHRSTGQYPFDGGWITDAGEELIKAARGGPSIPFTNALDRWLETPPNKD